MITADVVRVMLFVEVVVTALLALVYLWQRQMSRMAFFCWGMLALLVPVLGPFMVIASRPGKWNPSFTFSAAARDLFSLAGDALHRFLPVEPSKKKRTHAARLRERRQVIR